MLLWELVSRKPALTRHLNRYEFTSIVYNKTYEKVYQFWPLGKTSRSTIKTCWKNNDEGWGLKGLLSNFIQTSIGNDHGWVIWCVQHQEVHRLLLSAEKRTERSLKCPLRYALEDIGLKGSGSLLVRLYRDAGHLQLSAHLPNFKRLSNGPFIEWK